MKGEIELFRLPLSQSAIVKRIDGNNTLKDRIISLGVTEGADITSVFRSPFGDPTAYLVKGCLVALRKEDCRGIRVSVRGRQNETV